MFARAMASPSHPILAQIIPIRRCNLSCTYCNEYDRTSAPVPTAAMFERIDQLAALGTTIITLSGGEPMLHPDCGAIIRHIRRRGAIATLITNGYFLTPASIRGLNRAGLDYLQISIDNVLPDDVSKKSLKVLDRKLQWLAEHAEFDVTINSVLGSTIRNPEDAYTIAVRARELGFTSTVAVIHDGHGQLVPLDEHRRGIHARILKLGTGLFSFAHYDKFQLNIINARPNAWHCRAGGRFLYICEDGLVHYCSQQRGAPGIPLAEYTSRHVVEESARKKECAPFCTVSCVHNVAMLDSFREQPREALAGILDRRLQQDPAFEPPPLVRLLAWTFLESRGRGLFGKAAVHLLGAKPDREIQKF
jgi:MoaA/NifB/PqqE/SkfB family radical SAM enzyme